MTRARRVVFLATLAMAVYILVSPFALSLFSRTRDAEHLSDYYRPLMSTKGVNDFRNRLNVVDAAGKQLYGKLLPDLERDLGMDEAEFTAYVDQNFPHVAAFLKRAPVVLKYLNPATKAVLAQKKNFHDADQFPVGNLDVRVGPWALLVLGFGLLAVALLIRLSTVALPIIAVVVAGAALIVGPIVLGWFNQTDAAEQVAQVARGPFSRALANTTVSDTFHFDAAITEMREAMFPAVARALDVSDSELNSTLHSDYPATMKFLDAWERHGYKAAHDLSLSQLRFSDEFHNADATPYKALPWIFIAPGIVLLLAGGYGLMRRQEEVT